MRLLLDTHTLLWFCEGHPALSGTARAALEDPTNVRFVSHATAWEIAIKLNLGKLKLQSGYDSIFPSMLDADGFRFLAPSLAHYRALISMPLHHRDPFDRLLIAQAQAESMTLVSCDPHFPAYGVPILW